MTHLLAGMRFGRLTAIEPGKNRRHGELRWRCACDCGGSKTVLGSLLRLGKTRSCGGLQREMYRSRRKPKPVKQPRRNGR